MGIMEPSYLDGRTKTAEIMRRLLFAGAIGVADADNSISEDEIAVFEEFFGTGAFSDRLNIEKIKRDLPHRIENARDNTTLSQRMQVLRDLCLIVKAKSRDRGRERRALIDISEALNVFPVFVETQLDTNTELD